MAGGGGDSRWLISYADLVTLLMAFFVALYGISQADTVKFKRFLGGLGPFGNEAAVSDGLLDGGSSLVGDQNGQQPTIQPGKSSGADAGPGAAGSHPTTLTQSEVDSVISDLRAQLAAKGLQDAVRFRHDPRGLVAAIATDDVLFQTGSADIGAGGREIVGAIGPRLSQLTNDVVVEGHTDNVPLVRAGYSNWNLSTDRAVAVVRLLQESFGVAPERLTATGYGEFRPVAGNADAKGRATNRRVEIVVVVDGSEDKADATAAPTPTETPAPAETPATGASNAEGGKEQAHG